MATMSTLRDHQVVEHAAKEECLTSTRDGKENVTFIGDGKHNINLHSRLTVPKRFLKETTGKTMHLTMYIYFSRLTKTVSKK